MSATNDPASVILAMRSPPGLALLEPDALQADHAVRNMLKALHGVRPQLDLGVVVEPDVRRVLGSEPRDPGVEARALALVRLGPRLVQQLVHLRIVVAHAVQAALAVEEHVGVAVGVGPSGPADAERGEVVAGEGGGG